jgi:hypothetical protein
MVLVVKCLTALHRVLRSFKFMIIFFSIVIHVASRRQRERTRLNEHLPFFLVCPWLGARDAVHSGGGTGACHSDAARASDTCFLCPDHGKTAADLRGIFCCLGYRRTKVRSTEVQKEKEDKVAQQVQELIQWPALTASRRFKEEEEEEEEDLSRKCSTGFSFFCSRSTRLQRPARHAPTAPKAALNQAPLARVPTPPARRCGI